MDAKSINESISTCKHRNVLDSDFACCEITGCCCFPITDSLHNNFCLLNTAFQKGYDTGKIIGESEGIEACKDVYAIGKDW